MNMNPIEHKTWDYVIVGAGIIGLTIAQRITDQHPSASVLILDKEESLATHASGRNSGVLHAGFYYTADSLKARLTVEGNQRLTAFCDAHGLKINKCGKLVVAQTPAEAEQIDELYRRGQCNGSTVKIISVAEAREMEPHVRSVDKVLYSPRTSTVDPKEVCQKLFTILQERGAVFQFGTAYCKRQADTIETTAGAIRFKHLINCAGLFADRIAQDFGFGEGYTLIPFKGLYLKYTKNKTDVRMNIYPVPNLKNPFLGVHFTKTVDGTIKIGPTAIPAFWREHYDGWEGFNLKDFWEVIRYESQLFLTNAFGFRSLAIDELKKHIKSHFVKLSMNLVDGLDPTGFTTWTPPGIRAQLLDTRQHKLVQDFVVQGDQNSTHILNAVSPAFTCSFSFAEYVYEHYLEPHSDLSSPTKP